MSEEEIVIKADSLEEARAQLKSQVPHGLAVLSEEIISDGTPETSEGVGDTIEAAFQQAQGKLPRRAEVIERKQLIAPSETVIEVEAFDEERAVAQAKRRIDNTKSLSGVALIANGKKGVLWIGRTPNRYEVRIYQRAVVEITFKEKVKIRATVGEKLKCERCGERANNLQTVQLLVANTGNRSNDLQVCDKCFLELMFKAQGMRFE